MAEIEKGRPAGSPIPNYVLADNSDSTLSPLRHQLQTSRLVRLYAVNAAMAEALAPLVFLGGMRS